MNTFDAAVRTNTLIVDAVPASVNRVIEFVANFASETDCSQSARNQLSVCVDEVFANVSQYAYGNGSGELRVDVAAFDEPSCLQVIFRDRGVAFNPLEAEDPNVELPLDQRDIGGLGIFVTKMLADEVKYVRDGDCNVLTIVKRF